MAKSRVVPFFERVNSLRTYVQEKGTMNTRFFDFSRVYFFVCLVNFKGILHGVVSK